MEEDDRLLSRKRPPPSPSSGSNDAQNQPRPPPAVVCACLCVGLMMIAAILSLMSFAVVWVFPYAPDFKVDRIRLMDFHASGGSDNATIKGAIKPTVSLKNNAVFFLLEYQRLGATVAYHSTVLGSTDVSSSGRLSEKESWTANFVVKFESPVENDEISEDLAEDHIPLELTLVAHLKMGFLVFYLPFEKISRCVVYVRASNSAIVRQDCYVK